jgi:predicted RNA binding protein YcfA (HicA-like mRNA interferase family)
MAAKVLARILSGNRDANVRFKDLVKALHDLGFEERIKGDHHIFTKESVEEILNLQPRKSFAKPYQVKQVRSVIVKYRLAKDVE